MKFSCRRCGKLFSTARDPVPGRVYRVPCKCGNMIVLYGEAPGAVPSPLAPPRRTVPPPLPKATPPPSAATGGTPAKTDPFAAPPIASDEGSPERRTASAGDASTETENPNVRAPVALARRDPDYEASDRMEASWAFPVLVRRAFASLVGRAEAFVLLHVTPGRASAAAVVVAAIGLATWFSFATSGSTATATGVMALERSEHPPDPATAPGARRPRARSAGAAAFPRVDGSQRLAEKDEPVDSAGGDAARASADRGDPPALNAAEPAAVAADLTGVALAHEPAEAGAAAHAPDGDASPNPATRPAKTVRSAETAGRAPETRDVIAALRDRQSALEECIDDASRRGAPAWLGQRIRLVMMIDPSGRVSGADFEDDEISATPLAACVRTIAMGISLRAFEGTPVLITVPLRLGDG